MKKAINQWCFAEGTPLPEVLDVAAKAGFSAVELNLNDEQGIGLTPSTSTSEARLIARNASDRNLQLLSVSTGLLWTYPLSSDDPEIRGRGMAIVRKQLELAAVLGANTVLVVPGVVTPEVNYDECYKRSQDALWALSNIAAELGVCIGVENVWNKFLLSPREMKQYVDDMGTPSVGIYFDIGNVLQFGYPQHWISILGERIKKVHIKDFSIKVGNINGFVPLLAGDVNWPIVVKELREIGYDDVLTAEIPPYANNVYQSAFDISRQMDVILEM
ncbi:sugar phosphate isomerase/epimerase family protein [Alicyclobacillus ferrooxydans]|uniref:Xylulose 5-phosphate 3-epimerase n=1 Tax=Alicyclobacillus ferrooxydans TaxID=471514 RepID=A0A0N8PPC4_9BACL|nr:sugar phosphate isomerase/epimerase family protein [Alicyclobacillus ferrooxydans]KPV43933.1 xylulose 5-phosphate 3-epimerase [Alicyclobacillus ferrooxydans]